MRGKDQTDAAVTGAEQEERPVDARDLLHEVAVRWRAAYSLEYKSQAILDHQGEFRIDVSIHARLLRPDKMRLVFRGSRQEASRIRMIDGRMIYDRLQRVRQTQISPFRGQFLEQISHPLDDAGYSVQQFFARLPFSPPSTWGDPDKPLTMTAVRTLQGPDNQRSKSELYRVTMTRGIAKDTIWLDKISLAPLRLIRYGLHGGVPQVLLDETFTEVKLGVPFSPSLFVWNREDDAGQIR